MGKRELLLIIGFVAVGAVLFQLTAPAGQSGDSVFSAGRRILDEIRREVRGRPAHAEITTNATHPVPPGVSELRVTLRNTPVTVTGEDRADIATELWVRSDGLDETDAKTVAAKAELKVEPAGPTITVSLTFPPEGSQRGRLLIRVPAAMLVQFGTTNTRIEVTGVQAVELEGARGETIIKRIKGRVGVTHRGGEFTVEDVGSVRLSTRGSDLRLARVSGETTLEIQSGDVRAGELMGPVEIDAEHGDITLENLQRTPGPLRIKTVEGSLAIRGLRAETRIDGNETDIDVAIEAAAPIAIFSTGERIQITPPRDGFTLDAVAVGGSITVPDPLAQQLTISGKPEDKEQRASGKIGGGGPTVTLRATRGEIRVNARESS